MSKLRLETKSGHFDQERGKPLFGAVGMPKAVETKTSRKLAINSMTDRSIS